MPNRIIRESACTSPTLDPLSDGAERCFWRLITTADDYGRFIAEPRAVLSACFPLKIGTLPVKRVARWLEEMGAVGLVSFYRVRERVFGYFVAAEKYFNRRARHSKYPDPAAANICSHVLADVCTCEQMRADAIIEKGPGRADTATRKHVRADASRCLHLLADAPEDRGSRIEESRIEESGNSADGKPALLPGAAKGFQIPSSIAAALTRAPHLGADPRITSPTYWRAEVRANQGIDFSTEVLKAEAWIEANPKKAPRSNFSRFLHAWLGRVPRGPEA